jgi:predicted Zn-dependent protease
LTLIGFLVAISDSILFTHFISNVYRRLFFTSVSIFFIFQINNYIPSFNDAVSFNKSGITNSPNNAYLNNCYGVALSDANQSNEALPYFQKAYKLDTSLKNVRLYIARYDLIPNKKYDSAKILLLQEILKTPNNADNYYALSTIGFETKDYSFCEKYLEKYIQLRPDNIPIQQFAISIYSQNHHYSKANDLANHLKSNSITNANSLFLEALKGLIKMVFCLNLSLS